MLGRRLRVEILPQPDDFTCGPTCLHAVYKFYRDDVPLEQVISEVQNLDGGGTLAVLLGCHALSRGYRATIHTNNIQVFDPTWFTEPRADLAERLVKQRKAKADPKLHVATAGYLEFLEKGGSVLWADVFPSIITTHLKKGVPILTGLSATYLYRCAREIGPIPKYDDVRGDPAGHFVVLSGYEWRRRKVLIADPLNPNPMSPTRQYAHDLQRVACAVLLGVLTYDANLLIIEKPRG